MKIYTNDLFKGHSDFKVKCLTFGLYTQVSDSGPLGPLVIKSHCHPPIPIVLTSQQTSYKEWLNGDNSGMDKFPLILTFLSEKVQLSGWKCSPFWDDDTDIEASFSKSFQTLLGISGLSSICCVTSSNKSYQLFLVDVLQMEFLIICLKESPFFHQNIHRKNNSRAALCHD